MSQELLQVILTCLVVLLTTGLTGIVRVTILYLRTLSGKVTFYLQIMK